MQYSVPQFIDIEDKIILSLTWSQTAWLFGAGGAAWTIFVIVEKINPEASIVFKLLLASPIIALGAALAFIKVNKRPFIDFLEALFIYSISPKKYLWKKQENKKHQRQVTHNPQDTAITIQQEYVPAISNRSKIRELAWSLDMDSGN